MPEPTGSAGPHPGRGLRRVPHRCPPGTHGPAAHHPAGHPGPRGRRARIDAWGPEARAPLHRAHLDEGNPVVVFGGWGCGACRECAAGEEQRCERGESPGFQLDGGYAEYMLVPHPRYLVRIGDLHADHAAPLADAGVTPFRAVRRAAPWLAPGARVLLIGFGGLGQFALQYLRRIARPHRRGSGDQPGKAPARRDPRGRPGPPRGRRVAGDAGPGRAGGRRLRLRRDR